MESLDRPDFARGIEVMEVAMMSVVAVVVVSREWLLWWWSCFSDYFICFGARSFLFVLVDVMGAVSDTRKVGDYWWWSVVEFMHLKALFFWLVIVIIKSKH